MTIEIGVGAGGKEHDLLMAEKAGEVLERIAASPAGPIIVTPENIYNMGRRVIEKMGFKSADPYLTDPKKAPPQEPQPDPAVQKAQAELQMKSQEIQMKDALERERMDREFALAERAQEGEFALKRDAIVMNAEAKAAQTNMRAVRPGGEVG